MALNFQQHTQQPQQTCFLTLRRQKYNIKDSNFMIPVGMSFGSPVTCI
jgi:hypothetical protein